MSVTAPAAPVAAPGRVEVDPAQVLALARHVLAIEADAIAGLGARLGDAFVAAVVLILHCRGRVVVSGIGKSGHIARKLAATLASTGTPAFFVHPAEASHGDLGMITPDDVVVMLSNSGETDELVLLTPHLKRQGAAIVALTGNEQSSLAQAADVHLDAAVDAEACPLGLAPTASTTATLALGDALALALLDARGFSVEDFARSHPGRPLGRRLLTRVRDVMVSGAALPIVGRRRDARRGSRRDDRQGHGHDGRGRRRRAHRRDLHRRRPAPLPRSRARHRRDGRERRHDAHAREPSVPIGWRSSAWI